MVSLSEAGEKPSGHNPMHNIGIGMDVDNEHGQKLALDIAAGFAKVHNKRRC